MSVSLDYGENGRLMIITVKHPWTIAEFMATYPQMKSDLDAANFNIHLLLDFSEAGMWTGNALLARHAPYNTHKNRGHAAVITTLPILKTVSEAMIRISHIPNVNFFATKKEALEFLQRFIQQESAPNLK